MEYKRPDDILLLHPDVLYRLRDSLAAELALLEDVSNDMIPSECTLCGKTGYGYQGLPEDWGWLYGDYPALLCSDCIGRWTERFGAPKVHREGDIIDDDSSISEDSAHRGQATFDLV